jgi:hypothetical protein
MVAACHNNGRTLLTSSRSGGRSVAGVKVRWHREALHESHVIAQLGQEVVYAASDHVRIMRSHLRIQAHAPEFKSDPNIPFASLYTNYTHTHARMSHLLSLLRDSCEVHMAAVQRCMHATIL